MYNPNDASKLLAFLIENHDLYLSIFKGRDDVVARRWPQAKPYFPICVNRNNALVCPKHDDKTFRCDDCRTKEYTGITETILTAHLNGKHQLGCYPLLKDATSWFVAGDFDDHDDKTPRNPLEDVQGFVAVAKKYGIPVYVLSSKSGKGYHVYAFFNEAVPATVSRSAFLGMLTESGINVTCKTDGSYDRLFPAQEKHSGSGYGNLIGMPFQGDCVRDGLTIFIDPQTGEAYPGEEQIRMLENIERVSESQLLQAPKFTAPAPLVIKTGSTKQHVQLNNYEKFVLPQTIPAGMRNDYMFKLACSLRSRKLEESTLRLTLHAENQAKCDPPLEVFEVDAAINSSEKYPQTQNNYKFALTDLGNAERFASQHMDKVRHCSSRNQWFVWDGKKFEEDEVGTVHQLAYKTVRSIYGEAAMASSEDERKPIAKHAMFSENGNKIDQMIKHAKNQPGIPVRQKELDADNWLINCYNGVLDLKTQTLHDHDAKHLMTKIALAQYNKEAHSPLWETFLNRIFGNNQAIIKYLQKVVGVSLTGQTLQAIFILHGIGANGKSTFLEVVRRMLGNYAHQADFNTFIEQKNSTVREDLASLSGARVVMASECDSGKNLSEAIVKQITGGEAIRSRFLYGRSFEYVPTFNIFLATNHRPNVQGTDLGIWRRLKLIPFNVTIPEPERDEEFIDKLLEEIDGIFAWAVEGCALWQSEGLQEPDDVKAATQEYRADNDILTEFIAERLEHDASYKTDLKDMYNEYVSWSDENGIKRPLGKQAFNSKLRERGWKEIHSGTKHWRGVRIKPVGFGDNADIDPENPFG